MNPGHVHISYHVSKLGVDIPSVSLPVGGTCRPDAPCFKKCYAQRGRFYFQSNKAHLQNNLKMQLSDEGTWIRIPLFPPNSI